MARRAHHNRLDGLKHMAAPYVAAAMLACGFGVMLDRHNLPNASAEGGTVAIASAALGPIGAAAPYAPPLASLGSVAGVPFRDGEAIDESYRLAFTACDSSDVFRGAPAHESACTEEPNDFSAFIRLEGGAVYMQANLGLDLSGGYAACDGAPGEECAPFFDFADAPGEAYDDLGARWRELFPVSDELALISVPLRAGPGARDDARAFAELSGVSIGDVGVVVYRDKIVPVMVYDGAPRHRALAGSLGLFDAIGVSRCRRAVEDQPTLCAEPKEYGLGAPVIAILFPDSAPAGLTPENIGAKVSGAALSRFQRLR